MCYCWSLPGAHLSDESHNEACDESHEKFLTGKDKEGEKEEKRECATQKEP